MTGGWLDVPGLGGPICAFIGWQEIAAIFVIVLIVFGPKSIPEVARILGKFMQQFREASAELQRNLYLDDVKDIQRELRNTWRTNPERMRTVKPGAKHAPEDEAPVVSETTDGAGETPEIPEEPEAIDERVEEPKRPDETEEEASPQEKNEDEKPS